MKLLKRLQLGALALAGISALSFAAQAEDRTFNIWWYASPESAQGIAWAAALEEFKTSHPGVKVNFQQKTFDQMVKAGTMVLNSNEAPDITEFNKGNAIAGLATSQGLLTPLDDVAKERGWDKVLNAANTQLGRYDENGHYGSGPLVGVSGYGEFVSVFYNEGLFAKYNLTVPTTLAEMEADMDVFVKNGITPIAIGSADSNGQHLMYSLALSQADDAWVDTYQGVKAPLDPKPFVFAAQKLQDWVAKGYISKDATGLTGDDAVNQFSSGQAPMMVTGTWFTGTFAARIKDFKWNQFLFPGNKYSPASTGNLFVVPASAKEKDLAYDFIGITLSRENQALFANSGGVAIAADPADVTNPIGQRSVSLFKEIADKGGLGFYPDWPVPGFYDVVLQATTAAIGSAATPEEFGARLKKAYDDGMNE
jgi:raffinose/stachyose/melibiose transport system substrate-binding protein